MDAAVRLTSAAPLRYDDCASSSWVRSFRFSTCSSNLSLRFFSFSFACFDSFSRSSSVFDREETVIINAILKKSNVSKSLKRSLAVMWELKTGISAKRRIFAVTKIVDQRVEKIAAPIIKTSGVFPNNVEATFSTPAARITTVLIEPATTRNRMPCI